MTSRPSPSQSLHLALWALSSEDALHAIDTPEKGLAEHTVIERRKAHGENQIPDTHHLDAVQILVRQFSSPLILILVGAAALTVYLHDWLEAVIILLAVFVNTGLGFYQEYRAETTLEELKTYVKERTRVVRDGIEQEIDSALVVPGDILKISIGNRIPADARILEIHSLSVDESILTGESLPIQKQTDVLSEGTPLAERTNMVHAGTLVVEGTATVLVAATGINTEIGRIAKLVSETGFEPTPLQKALANLARVIFIGVTVLVLLILALGLYRGESFIDMLLIAIAIAVGAIPEALPIALTVILAIGLQRLATKKGIMRSLSAAETLGSSTIVMTDKTGTLTEARMRLTSIYTTRDLSATKLPQKKLDRLTATSRSVLESAVISTNVLIENQHEHSEKWELVGHPIETSIIRAATEHNLDARTLRQSSLLLPFNSNNKFSVGFHPESNTMVALGAPEILLARADLSKEAYVAAEQAIRTIASEGKRVLGVAKFSKGDSRKLAPAKFSEKDVRHLQFLGILVFEDPLRPEAKQALEKIQGLGAHVVMITGDLKETALSIGRELGWEIDEGHVLSGEELRALSDQELLPNLRNIRIFARVTPEDKLRIGKLYKQLGEVVAMTGDGVNDAPSLKAVDIGIALGSGTDVAKAAADLVLLDDNFKTIVAAIEEGRRMLGNIRKTTVYLLSTSLDEVILIGGALLVGLPLPLTALQIIWINLFTESFPALAYAFDEHVDSTRGTKGDVSAIFNREVKVLTIGIGTLTSVLMFAMYWTLLNSGTSLEDARSIVFLCFASYILFVAFSLRSLRAPIYSYDVFGNKVLNGSVIAAILVFSATIVIPSLREIFSVTIPPPHLLWIVGVWLVANLLIIEIAKWSFRAFSKN